MFGRRRAALVIEGTWCYLRPPVMADHLQWAALRRESMGFLQAWEPIWAPDHLSRTAFRNRVNWAERLIKDGRGAPLFIFRIGDDALIGAITLDNLRRGPAMMATVGYWIGVSYARQGWMGDALTALRDHAFAQMDITRIEAACLPENTASRALLDRCGFVHEGMARAYLQIGGHWRDHALYAALRDDRMAD